MSADEFFNKIDQKLQNQKNVKASSKVTEDENLTFLKEVVLRITPLTEDYAAKLQDRGMKVSIKTSDYSISFSLFFKDGGHYAVILGSSDPSNRIEITVDFTNDDGRNFTSRSGATYNAETWKDEIYEESLRKCIEDFIFYADRHGGL